MLRDLSDCISVARKAIVLTTPTAMSKPNVRRLLGIRKKLLSAVLSAPCSQNVTFVSPSTGEDAWIPTDVLGALAVSPSRCFCDSITAFIDLVYASTDVVATSVASKAKKILEWSPGPWFYP